MTFETDHVAASWRMLTWTWVFLALITIGVVAAVPWIINLAIHFFATISGR
jgi:hypothetical protein